MSSEQPLGIRRAGVADLRLLAPLFDEYRQFYHQPADPVLAQQYLASRLERDESVVFLAASDTVGYGFVQLYPSFCSVAVRPLWILYDLFVTPAARKHGVAKKLMERGRRFAIETKAKGLILETAVDNVAAQKLYERLGWKRDMSFDRYYLDV